MKLMFAAIALALLHCHVSCAADRFVSLSGTNDFANKFTTWSGAATDIQWAVNAALPGETVWVSNGTYYLTNHVFITNGILLKSFSGTFTDTTVNGNNYAAKGITNRCFYLNHSNLVVDGFTITNGYMTGANAYGAGVFMAAGTLKACLVTGNTASNSADVTTGGGGVCASGLSSLITNCDIIANLVYDAGPTSDGGGGVMLRTGAQAWNSRIKFNQCPIYWSAGGAVHCYDGTPLLVNCEIISNTAANAYNCGGVYVRLAAVLRNCLIVGNARGNASSPAAGVGTSGAGTKVSLENCTIAGNTGQGIGTSWHGGDFYLTNTVCYSNTIATISTANGALVMVNSCVSSTNNMTGGSNTTTNNPVFENYAAGNYRLSRQSPCINAGVYHAWMNTINDLDNKSRADKFSGIPDIGCYEYHPQGLMFKVR
ncbi:MAG: hypothetical protein WC299_09485 [Kiritimatiellia bacterium]